MSVAEGCAKVQGRCPACGCSSLFLGNGGYVTCGLLGCPDPTAANRNIGDDIAVIYQRAQESAEGARAERDIMRAAVEEIAAGTLRPAHFVAQQALDADRARREANLAALSAPRQERKS